MRTTEAKLFAAFPPLSLEGQTREVTSMSDLVHTGRAVLAAESRTFEPRLLFGTCYALFLLRAVARRLMPRRGEHASHERRPRESIFREAWSSASVMVVASFMGL
jgi:hypothetical protein